MWLPLEGQAAIATKIIGHYLAERGSSMASRITRRRVLGGLGALGACSLLPGCGGSGSAAPAPSPLSAPPPQPVPAGPLTSASVTVSTTSSGAIGSNFVGLSYDKTEMLHPFFSASNSNLLGLFQRIGPGLLRVGGDGADKCTWTPDGRGQTYPQIAQSDVDSWAAFVKASGWQVLYGVNLGGSALPAGTAGHTTPALAAAEIAYVSGQLGSSLYGIEIGNEPDRYGNYRSYYACNWSLAQYEALWSEYRSAILATTPGVFITGPAGGQLAVWTIPFSETETSGNLGLLTDHYYRLTSVYPPSMGCSGTIPGGGSTPTIAELIAYPDQTLVSNLGLLAKAQKTTGIAYRLGETNSGSNAGTSPVAGITGISNSYASALWIIDHMFTCALGGATGVNLTSGNGGYYSPIGDDESVVTSVQPEFYGVLLFYLAGQGTLYSTQVSAGSLNVSAYAVQTSAGWSVVVVNKDPTENLQLTVQLPQSASSATLMVMTQATSGATGPSLEATSGVSIQGAPVNLDGTFSPSASYQLTTGGSDVPCYVPALSAVLIQTT